MSDTNQTAMPCPHPGCQAVLRLRESLPAGIYRCLCHACQVRLTWSTRQPTCTRWPYATCACGTDAAAAQQEATP